MSSPILEARDVYKTYQLGRVDVPVLKGCSMHVNHGEFLAILGSSGSGKSTLMHVLGGLDRTDCGRGDVLHEGSPITGRSERQLNRYRARTIGFVFQFYHLLPELTVLENAMLPGLVPGGIGRNNAKRRARSLLAACCIYRFPLLLARVPGHPARLLEACSTLLDETMLLVHMR